MDVEPIHNHRACIGLQDSTDQPEISLVYLPPKPQQTWSALAGTAILLLGLAVLAPFAAQPLPQVNGFVPALDATTFVTDFITTVLLLAHFSITRSRALLALACGYLFSALIVVAHALSFPGAFSPTGNLGGSSQTTVRLYLIWHLGLPAALFAYVRLKDEDRTKAGTPTPTTLVVIGSVMGVLVLAGCTVWLAAAGDGLLPSALIDPSRSSPIAAWLVVFTMLICAAALFVLWVFRRSALDQWLMVVVLASIVELAITAPFGGPRFTLGFYTGRIFSLVTSTGVLTALLAETTRLYASLARANMLLERERNNRLMNVEAVTAAIAHEMAQPLAAIATNGDAALEFLASLPPDLDEARIALSDMIEGSHRTADAIDGIRGLFRKTNQTRQPVDLNEVAREVLQSMRVELKQNDIVSRSELTTDMPVVEGNRSQLHQVVFNLVHNAVEAMSVTSDQDRVLRLLTKRQGRTVLIAVRDSGPGIDPKQLDNIFDAFVTTKARGMGLGLAICRTIVESHGGRLTAASDGKDGALFEVVLPIKAQS